MVRSARHAGLCETTDRTGPRPPLPYPAAWLAKQSRRSGVTQGVRAYADRPRSVRVRLRRQAEIGEGAIKLPIEDEPRHLAVADVEQVCTFCRHLTDLQAARLGDAAIAMQHQDPLVVKFAELLGRDAILRVSV